MTSVGGESVERPVDGVFRNNDITTGEIRLVLYGCAEDLEVISGGTFNEFVDGGVEFPDVIVPGSTEILDLIRCEACPQGGRGVVERVTEDIVGHGDRHGDRTQLVLDHGDQLITVALLLHIDLEKRHVLGAELLLGDPTHMALVLGEDHDVWICGMKWGEWIGDV